MAIDEMPGVFDIKRSLSKRGCPYRLRGGRVHEQDPEGGIRLPGEVLDSAQAPGEAERLCPLVQQLQASFDPRLHEPG